MIVAVDITILVFGVQHAHMPFFPPMSCSIPTQPPWLPFGAYLILKGLMMNSRFLRDEAARFRGMADTADREATRLRFLAMAVDYDARANVADEVTEQTSSEIDTEPPEPRLEEVTTGLTEPEQGEALSVKPRGRPSKESKEAIVVERRPVGRHR
jgi:hypothetical protein